MYGVVQNISTDLLEQLLSSYMVLKQNNLIPEKENLEGLEFLISPEKIAHDKKIEAIDKKAEKNKAEREKPKTKAIEKVKNLKMFGEEEEPEEEDEEDCNSDFFENEEE